MVFPNLQLIHVHSPNDLLRSNSDRHPLWHHSECSKLSMRTMSHMMIHTLVEGSLVKSIGPHSGSACPRTQPRIIYFLQSGVGMSLPSTL